MRRSDPSKSQITKLMPDASNISIAGGGGGGGNRLLPPTSPAMSNSSQSSGGSVASPLASPRGSIRRKLVVIGDGACGKTSLLLAYRNGRFSDSYVPTVFENSTVTVPVEDKLVELSLWDTAGIPPPSSSPLIYFYLVVILGQEDYDRLRPLSYPNSHVILVCCAVNNAESFANIYRKWQHELDQYCPGVPRIVVGCKTDLRLDSVDEHITTAQVCHRFCII